MMSYGESWIYPLHEILFVVWSFEQIENSYPAAEANSGKSVWY